MSHDGEKTSKSRRGKGGVLWVDHHWLWSLCVRAELLLGAWAAHGNDDKVQQDRLGPLGAWASPGQLARGVLCDPPVLWSSCRGGGGRGRGRWRTPCGWRLCGVGA